MTIRSCIPPLAALLIAGSLLASPQTVSHAERARIQAQMPARLAHSLARLEGFKSQFGLERSGEFRLSASHVDEFGQTHARYSQFHQGVRVWGAQAITHMDGRGGFLQDTLALRKRIQINTQPTLQAGEVLAKVQADLGVRGVFAAEPKSELVIYPETEQIIHRFMTNGDQIPNALEAERLVKKHRLAYHVQTRLDNDVDGLKQMDYLVDAHSGKILKRWSSLKTAEPAIGTGRSFYNGEVKLNTTKVNSGFELRDLTRPTQPHPATGEMGNLITDVKNISDDAKFQMGSLMTDSDNVWGDGANYQEGGSDDNRQTQAVDAAYGMQATWDFLKNVLGRNGVDDKGSSVKGRVHSGARYSNANWWDDCYCMTFGDGNPEGGERNFAVLEITAHELGHGVCGQTAKLEYMDEFGGLNEANSDIIGTMVEFYTRGEGKGDIIPDTDKANWVMGEDLYADGIPMRYMYKPSLDAPKDGNGQVVYPWGWYSPDAWRPDLGMIDVHLSSGPMNRAFYFLSEGAEKTGDKSAPEYLPNGMTGIGKTNAMRIWYRAMRDYLTPLSMYVDARNACIRAAQDVELAPVGGAPVSRDMAIAAVQNAFAGINVGYPAGAPLDKTAPRISDGNLSGTSGTINISVKATDDTGVTLVEFWVDGFRLASIKESTSGVFSFPLNSTTLKQGQHEMVVKAFDKAGNVGYWPEEKGNVIVFSVENAEQQVFKNGGFEQGPWPWNWNGFINILHANEAKENYAGATPYEGEFFAHIGGTGKAYVEATEIEPEQNVSSLFQIASLPLVAEKMALQCAIRTDTEEAKESPAVDTLDILLLEVRAGRLNFLEKLGSVSNQMASDKYEQLRFPIKNEYKGKNVAIYFEAKENEGKATRWLVDNVSLVMGVNATPSLDLNKDQSVDVYDLAVMAQYYRQFTESGNEKVFEVDLNGDGVINEDDVKKLLKGF